MIKSTALFFFKQVVSLELDVFRNVCYGAAMFNRSNAVEIVIFSPTPPSTSQSFRPFDLLPSLSPTTSVLALGIRTPTTCALGPKPGSLSST